MRLRLYVRELPSPTTRGGFVVLSFSKPHQSCAKRARRGARPLSRDGWRDRLRAHEDPRRRRVRSRQAPRRSRRSSSRARSAGEVLVEIKATGVCHTDEFTRSGARSRGPVPGDLRPRGRGRRASRSAPASPRVAAGRPRDPALHAGVPRVQVVPQSRKTNLCTAIRATQGKGLMPDGTSRFSLAARPIHHYMGCSTFANHTVLPEIALAKVRKDAPFDKICYIGCGVTTGIGAVHLHREGRARRERRRVRPRRHRPQRRAGRAHGRRRQDRRRRHQPGARGARRASSA